MGNCWRFKAAGDPYVRIHCGNEKKSEEVEVVVIGGDIPTGTQGRPQLATLDLDKHLHRWRVGRSLCTVTVVFII
jgi:hypothetical protein